MEAAVPGGSSASECRKSPGFVFSSLLLRDCLTKEKRETERGKALVNESVRKLLAGCKRSSRGRQVWMCCGALGEGTEGGRQGGGRRPGRGGGVSVIRIAPWLFDDFQLLAGRAGGAELTAEASRLIRPQQRGLWGSHR